MRGSEGRRAYVSADGVRRLQAALSERDLAILHQVADLRLMSARQIGALHFPVGEHASPAAAARARQRVLMRLTRERLLVSLVRRIGGVRAGSGGLVLALGPVGQRVLRLDGGRRRGHEPGLRFVDHTLAIAQLVVDLTGVARSGGFDLTELQSEPACWRRFSGVGGGTSLLRPDLFVALGLDEYELRWFCEVDRSTESLPTVLRKCRLYADYYQSGVEQAAHAVFPRVCWITPDERRAARLREAIGRDRQLPAGLFHVTTSEQAVSALSLVKNISAMN